MSDFAPGGPQIPSPPFEVPEPDVPKANFQEIGQQLGDGLKKGGVLDGIAQGWLDKIADLVAKIIAAILGLVDLILIKILQLIFAGFDLSKSGMDQLAATVVSGMTGVAATPGNFSNARDRSGRQPIAGGLVKILTDALGTGAASDPEGGMHEGHEGADKFLEIVAHMAIEGWMFGIVAEIESLNYLERVGDLKDTLEAAMGLGRLARRALAAPMKILVEDPYTAELNSKYRPVVPSVEILIREYMRGHINRGTLDKLAGKSGYSAQGIEALINFNKLHLSPGDIETLRLHSALDDGTAKGLLYSQGYDDATASMLQAALRQGREDAWARTLVNESLTALEKRFITREQFQQQLEASGLPEDERRIITVVSNLKELISRKRFTIAEGETLVKKGIWQLEQFATLATELGYNAQDETDLELLVLTEIKDTADAAKKKAELQKQKAEQAAARAAAVKAKAAAAAAAAEAKGVSVARYETLVQDDIKHVADYRAFLVGKGIASDNIDALATALQAKLDKAAQAAAARPQLMAGAKAKNLDLAQLETAVRSGVVPLVDFGSLLQAVGFSPEDAALETQVLSDQLDAAKVKANVKTSAAGQAKAKKADLSQIQRGVRLGLLTVDDYAARLAALGFVSPDSDLLVAEMQKQLDADAAARATKAAVKTTSGAKGLNLAQLEQAVRAGVSTIYNYRAALSKAGYDAAAINQLVSLLELRTAQDQETLAAKGHAAALVGKSGLSLTDIERAVRLGIVPITLYSGELAKAGVSADDAQILTLSLAAQAKATKGAQATLKAVDAQLKLAGQNLTKLEQDVLSGFSNVEQLQAILAGAGVSDQDVQTVVTLVRDEVANAQHVATLTGKVAGSAAAKGLSLAQEEAAVKADVKTLDEFRAFVAALGYSAADVETLAETLASKLKTPQSAPPQTPVP